MKTLLHISHKENIKIENDEYCDIIEKSENKINLAIWLLELKKNNLNYDNNWNNVIDDIVKLVINTNNNTQKVLNSSLNNIKNMFYTLFITNISTKQIISKFLIKLLETQSDIKIKMEIIEITSIFETRISQGTRHIIHIEAYIIRLMYLFHKHNKGEEYYYNLDTLEI
jgi:replication factor C subunit 3/5